MHKIEILFGSLVPINNLISQGEMKAQGGLPLLTLALHDERYLSSLLLVIRPNGWYVQSYEKYYAGNLVFWLSLNGINRLTAVQ